MRNSKTVAITAVLFLILSAAFAMSGDGGQQPVKQEKGTEAVQVQQFEKSVQEPLYAQAVQPEGISSGQVEKTGERVTVKDRLGFETGMTKEELGKFKQEYAKEFKKLFPHLRDTAYEWLFDYNLDLSKYEELKKVGIDLKKTIGSLAEARSYKQNTIYSHIVVVGKTVNKINDGRLDYNTLEIETVLKGSEVFSNRFGNTPDSFEYVSLAWSVSETHPVIGVRAIYFLVIPLTDSYRMDKEWIMRIPESTILCLDDGKFLIKEKHYEAYTRDKQYLVSMFKQLEETGKPYNGFISEPCNVVINSINEIVKVLNISEFYKTSLKGR